MLVISFKTLKATSIWILLLNLIIIKAQEGTHEDYRYIDTEPKLSAFKKYCESEYLYSKYEPGYELDKVILVFRHGDRTPTRTYNSAWKREQCVVGETSLNTHSISNFKYRNCENGDLTYKGYNQMSKLGYFIRNNYFSKLCQNTSDLNNCLKLRATHVKRTHTSLNGVLYGMIGNSLDLDVEIPKSSLDALLIPLQCRYLSSIISKEKDEFYKSVKTEYFNHKKKYSGHNISDNYQTHICNKIPVNCKELSCDIDTIKDYMTSAEKTWESQSKTLQDESVLRFVFGRFAKRIKEILQEKEKMHIFAAHDGSITFLMSGLGIDSRVQPSYGALLAIEIWKNHDKKYIKILYNGNPVQSTIDKNSYISEEKFIKYLSVLEFDQEELSEKCKNI
ncbi:putative histidine phosphatase [Hamiltosporidium tvaerminnensis]|uniref:Putative histidine phosphatase n=1 Tax=Hamiltosporidium tvaerminnensis TaxID=1176355 RepID=A0A4Q9M430_9MICR|nr:putative histidine phosphatase [Hamiltosporidium tvaerminnensis]TBU21001.1 putative histidine phosphatase [Hamiltosporidium tvaerminnensis]